MRAFLVICAAAATLPCLAQDRYYTFFADLDRLGGAADFSFLNRPLTPADRLVVHDGHFYRVGKDLKPGTRDDERLRLFGVNLAFSGNFPEEKDAVRIARRLRRLGVNLVRLHHMDSSPDSDPQQARSILTTGPYPTLNPVAVSRLRNFLDALKAEGIYVNLNLHVGYAFRPAVDKVPAMPDGAAIPTQSKPLHIYYPRMVELQLEFTRKVIQALALKNDAVLGMVEIDNETSVVDAWQRGSLDRTSVGEYGAELRRQWNAFLRAKYRETASLSKAWGGLAEGQALESGTVALVTNKELAPEARVNDFLMFLVDCDRSYLRRMREEAQRNTDALVPVAGTQMGFGGLLNLDSHSGLEYNDNHFYIDHYNFPNRSWDTRDWRIRDSSSVGSGLATLLNMAAARETSKPYTVSEFNQPWPNRQAAEIDPTLAAFGAFQDWDSIMHFAYSHNRNWDERTPNGFDLNSDWSKDVSLGQSALLFRQGIQPARQALRIPVSLDVRLQLTRERRNGSIAPALAQLMEYDPALALQHRVGLARDDKAKWQPRKTSGAVTSDTGEITYDAAAKTMTVQAPGAAGVFGFTGARKVTAGAIDVELAPGSRGFVTLLVTALDQRPIRDSARMLLTVPGYTVGTQRGSDPPRPQRFIPYGQTSDWWTLEPEPAANPRPSGGMSGSAPPVYMERVECFVLLRTTADAIVVYPLDGTGARLEKLAAADVQKADGGFRIHLQADGQALAPWYEIVR
ncbi:MAG: hypothetical protein IT159_06155 [Bryobacterales bacterium]|nr:hypothetical protein [Bryobacterales bacterium]